jgi:hypothetical protein
MSRIINVTTGEVVYINTGDTIPDGWIAADVTFKSDATANIYSWFWVLIILFAVFYGLMIYYRKR